ncbi:hypothetical protein LXL04_005573 [Taraxacum kok-saghyz]
MAEIVVSAVISVLCEKLISGDLLKLARSEGIDSQLQKLKKNLPLIQAVLADASQKHITDRAVQLWVKELQELAYDIEDVLDDMATEAIRRKLTQEPSASTSNVTGKVLKLFPGCCTNFTPHNITYGRQMRSKLDEISNKLRDLVDQKNDLGLNVNVGRSNERERRQEETSLVDESKIMGREGDKEALLEKLLGNEECVGNVSIVSIVGMGGIGKTTLAKLLYNDQKVKDQFQLKAWVCVSEELDVFTVSKAIFQAVTGENKDFANLDLLHVALKEKLSKKKFLLVLDDIWNEERSKWEILQSPLLDGAPGSRVIVTTRSTNVASVMQSKDLYSLDVLSNEDALSLFAQHAVGEKNFDKHPNFKVLAEEIVKKCGKLPLALKTLGGALNGKTNVDEWEELLKSEIWEINDGNEILPALSLSYYYLPPHLKQLFAYCSLIPKDYVFDKNKLVLLWMAEGFLSSSKGNKSMERLGHQYFEELESKSFFQHATFNGEPGYTMHDLINDLATSVAGEFSFRSDAEMEVSDINKPFEKFRHFSLAGLRSASCTKFKELQRSKCLRTFLLMPVHLYVDLLDNVFDELLPKLQFLRVLSVMELEPNTSYYRPSFGEMITKLPESIGSLKHLRYLNFSYTGIRCLPEQVSNLYNLQSLLLHDCLELSGLPESFAKLINLRHLDISDTPNLKKTPLGIAGLTGLQTLPKVFVEEGNGFKISDLKGLSDLQGRLSIIGLEKVIDPIQAMDAKLHQKKDLDVLEMEWSYEFDDSRNETIEYEVLEKLRPPPKLKKLKILNNMGTRFPSWVDNPSFDQLTELTLDGCRSTQLPTLGLLGSLRKLFVTSMSEVKSVGFELLAPTNSFTGTAFPSLEVLVFNDMKGWQKWSIDIGHRSFPRLHEIFIGYCPELGEVSIGLIPSLRALHIRECSEAVLRSLVGCSSSLVKLEIWNVKGLTQLLHGEDFMHLGELEHLKIDNCNELRYLWEQDSVACKSLVSLQKLQVMFCEKLVSIAKKEVSPGISMKSLKLVEFDCCDSLESYSCPYIVESLRIVYCGSMTSLTTSTTHEHPSSIVSNCDNIQPISRLSSLHIKGCKNLKSISQGHFTALEEMTIISGMDYSFPCGLWPPNLRILKIGCLNKPMSEWGVQNFPSTLVHNCRNNLPKSFANLIHLRHLDINDTPNLKKMPLGIAGLTGLRTLTKVIVEEGKGFKISDLKGLLDLQGRLSIIGLEKMIDPIRAMDAKLHQKKDLDVLEMEWSDEFDDSRNETIEYEVLEKLRPPPKLKKLMILNNKGTIFPSWISDPLFDQLTGLTLDGCRSTQLPTLGLLGSLRELFVRRMGEVKSVGFELLAPTNSFTGTVFPSLEVLKFKDMEGWQKWSIDIGHRSFPRLHKIYIGDCPELGEVSIGLIPSLRVLHITECSEAVLRSLVGCSSSLVNLEIWNVKGLTQLLHGEDFMHLGELEHLKIKYCHELRYLWEQDSVACKSLVSLQKLQVTDCKKLVSIAAKEVSPGISMKSLKRVEFRGCVSLESYNCPYTVESLRIDYCGSMTSLTTSTTHEHPSSIVGNCDNIQPISRLSSLFIKGCNNLKLISQGHFTALEEMRIYDGMDYSFPCGLWPPNIRSLTIGSLNKPMSEWGVQNFPSSLVHLELYGERSGVVSFAVAEDVSNTAPSPTFLLPPSLVSLELYGFKDVESFSEVLQHLPFLKTLYIKNCPKIRDIKATSDPSSNLTISNTVVEKVCHLLALHLSYDLYPSLGFWALRGEENLVKGVEGVKQADGPVIEEIIVEQLNSEIFNSIMGIRSGLDGIKKSEPILASIQAMNAKFESRLDSIHRAISRLRFRRIGNKIDKKHHLMDRFSAAQMEEKLAADPIDTCYGVLTVHVRRVDLETNANLHDNLHLVDLAGSKKVDRFSQEFPMGAGFARFVELEPGVLVKYSSRLPVDLFAETNFLFFRIPMAEIVVSAVITVLCEKLISGDLLKLARSKGVNSQVQKLKDDLPLIQAVLADATQKHITDKAVQLWVNKLQELAYDIDDALDDLATEAIRRKLKQEAHASTGNITGKVLKFFPNCCTNLTPHNITYGRQMRSKLDEVSTKLSDLVYQKNGLGLNVNVGRSNITERRQEETSLVDESKIMGREGDKEALLEKLLGNDECVENVSIVSIVGMGGIGKTTLAKLLYNDQKVKDHFELRAWVCVSEDFDVLTVSKAIFEAVTREHKDFANLDLLHVALKEKLSKKKFLLVLDDVWNENYGKWEQLQSPLLDGAPGSRVIVTTRSTNVASVMHSKDKHSLDVLPNEDALSLFTLHAIGEKNFNKHPNLKSLGEAIVKQCGNLPLALKVIGGALNEKRNVDEWEELLKSDIWKIKDESEILPALRLSYYHLAPHLKQLFAYCSLIPKDYVIDKNKLVLLWVAEGFLSQSNENKSMERLGHQYFEELKSRSFFQYSTEDGESTLYTMHDLINDLATSVAGEFSFRSDAEMEVSYINKPFEKFRHIFLLRLQSASRLKELQRSKCLRTFLLMSCDFGLFDNVFHDLLPKLQFLRVLSVRDFSSIRYSTKIITKVPQSIGSLKHLRYLNFSGTAITCLPEQVSNLYNLQSLLLQNCFRLSSLPKSFAKLIKLRHLDISDTPNLKKTPLGIAGLTGLQTLSKVIVEEGKGFKISDLKGLSDLQGRLSIIGLEKVIDPIQAMNANLHQKKDLDVLEMEWSDEFDDSRNEKIEYEVLEKLRPPPKLKKLLILNNKGTRFPSWIGDDLFHQLTELTLCGCRSTQLPTLGLLGSLRKLSVKRMREVKSVGFELLAPTNSFTGTAFPSLEVLKFDNMKGWQKWSIDIGHCSFPRLHKISIRYCPELGEVSIGLIPSLRVLRVIGCSEAVLRSLVGCSSSLGVSSFNITGNVWKFIN